MRLRQPPVPLKYEDVVKGLQKKLSDKFDLSEIGRIIEHGYRGVRQLTNEEFCDEWEVHFGYPIEIADPESNPNTAGHRSHRYILWLEGEYDSEVVESVDGTGTEDKYVKAYEAACERGCPCQITDETDRRDDEPSELGATVYSDGIVDAPQGRSLPGVHARRIHMRAYLKDRASR